MCAPFVVSLPNIWWCGAWPTETVEKAFDGDKALSLARNGLRQRIHICQRQSLSRTLRAERCFGRAHIAVESESSYFASDGVNDTRLFEIKHPFS